MDILKSLAIKMNGNLRMAKRSYEYWKHIPAYECHKNKSGDLPGIYIIPFSLDPDNYQPSGFCNFSNLESFEIEIETRMPPTFADIIDTDGFSEYGSATEYLFKYDIDFYSINYNILRISSGLGGIAFI